MKLSRRKLAASLVHRLPAGSDKSFAQQVAAYLLSERRTGELGSLLRDIEQLRADAGMVEVVAVSAHPLTAGIKTDIERQIRQLYPNAKQVLITEKINEKQLGGVRLELANEQLDLSIRSKLHRFKQLTAVEN